jgi:hypothetical protein
MDVGLLWRFPNYSVGCMMHPAMFCWGCCHDSHGLCEIYLFDYLRAGAKEKDWDGRLFLHWAIATKASVEIARLLLAAHPDGQAASPHRDNYIQLFVHARAGAKEKDNDGHLPLHWACEKNAYMDVISALLAAHPDGKFAFLCREKPVSDSVFSTLFRIRVVNG